jgi:hypothetical protein
VGPKLVKLDNTDVAQFDKANVLERTGIEIRTAERYEELTGGKEKQLQDVATALKRVSARA